MLLIVAHHYVVNSGLIDVMAEAPTSAHSLYLYLFGMWGKTGINCFVLITGYFMCRSQITLRKFLKLVLEVLFYNVVIYACFVAAGYEQINMPTIVSKLLPIHNISDGFVSCFILFYLFIPFLNTLLQHLNQKQHATLMALCLFIYTIWGSIPYITCTFNYITWFCVLYVIASYIRFYGLMPKFNTAKWGLTSLAAIAISMASVVVLAIFNTRGHNVLPFYFAAESNKILAVAVSVPLFMLFKGINIPYSRVINTISASTFGVLCIHANSNAMRQWLWHDLLNNVGQYHNPNLVLISISAVLGVFAICIAIDWLRIHTIERYTFRFIDRILAKRAANPA